MDVLKVGIIGCGKISEAYFQGIRRYALLQVVACADQDVERAIRVAREQGIAKGCSVAELLADRDIALVVNLTVPQAHVEINLQILNAGKHAYTEKPFALDTQSGASVLALAKAKGLRVGSAPDTFLGGGIQTCRQLIDEGAIGQPVAATAFMLSRGHESWHPNPAFYYQKGGGPMFDMGPYYLTALVNLLGPVARVSGSARTTFSRRTITSQPLSGTTINVEVPTHYSGTMDFRSGAVGTIIMSFDTYPFPFPRIVIFGTEGTLEVPDPNIFGGEIRLSRKGGEYRVMPPTHSIDRGRGTGLADLVYALRSGRPHRANGELAQHVVEVMESFELSARAEKTINIASSCERPAALPPGLAADTLD